jgi:acyl dehydratase
MKPGDILDEWDFTVEAGKLREFARAVVQPDWASAEIAPPTFPVVASAAFVERLVTSLLDLDRSRTVHGEQAFVYARPIRAGDRLRCRASLVSDERKQGRRGGAMRVVVTEVAYTDARTGEPVCRETMTSIEKSAGSP